MTIGLLTQVVFPHTSGLSRDQVVHTFTANTNLTTPADADIDAWHTRLIAWYNTAGVSGWPAIATYLSGVLSRAANAAVMKSYLIPDARASMGSPKRVTPWTLAAASSANNFPSEVALVATRKAYLTAPAEVGAVAEIPTPMRAQRMGAPATHLGQTRPASSRRGRIFIGPLNESAAGNLATRTQEPTPDPHFIAAVLDAENALKDGGAAAMAFAVFSRKLWDVDNVAAGHVDNAFDIVRKRGPRATSKTTMTY